MMETDKIKSLAGQLKALVEANKGFALKLEKLLGSGSRKVESQSKFIAELFNEGVLCDGSNDAEMLVHLAVTLGCSKGADGIGGMLRALESSGNLKLLSGLHTWAKGNFQNEGDNDGGPSEPKQGASALQIPPRKNWRGNATTATELSLPNPPRSAATGLFIATINGLISLNLQTLEATVLTSEYTPAVTVNQNLRKVYWSEGAWNSRIVRSDFDGTAEEEIVPQTDEEISMLAIDETSGNVYFALLESDEIKVCNELGRNCATVKSISSIIELPVFFTLDSVKGFMYWSNNLEPGAYSLVRAELDGSNAEVVSTGFMHLSGITLEQPSGVVYWTDGDEKTIGTFDVHGGTKQALVELKREGNAGPHEIQVDARKIYFSNSGVRSIHSEIQSVNRGTGELTTIFKLKGSVHGLALFNAPA